MASDIAVSMPAVLLISFGADLRPAAALRSGVARLAPGLSSFCVAWLVPNYLHPVFPSTHGLQAADGLAETRGEHVRPWQRRGSASYNRSFRWCFVPVSEHGSGFGGRHFGGSPLAPVAGSTPLQRVLTLSPTGPGHAL